MHLKELTIAEFDQFAKACPIGSYYQSSSYALFMSEEGYSYDFIGFVDELGVLKAASLILIKKLNMSYKYGYAPRGVLVDYFDYDLLNSFMGALKEYYKDRLVFLKINPEIAIGEINLYTKITNYNQNIIIRDYLKEIGLTKLKDNLYFEALLPRFNAIVNTTTYDFNKLSKNTKNKIRKAEKRGLVFEVLNRDGMDILKKTLNIEKNNFYYDNYYNVFEKNNVCDVLLVKVDYKKYLINSQELYNKELERNNNLSSLLINNSDSINVNQKMDSDKKLLAYKNDIEIATKGLRDNSDTYVAGALVIKYKNRVNIVVSGMDKKYKHFNGNYFLFYNIIEYYKKDYKFIDLNGVTGDFSDGNPYKGLNQFKFGFKPKLYEFIGEFDFIFKEKAYKSLGKKGILAKEFNNKKS